MSLRAALKLYDREWDLPGPEFLRTFQALDSVPTPKRDCHWHHLRGICLYEMGRDDAAQAQFRRALALGAPLAFSSLYLGHSLFDQGRYADALPYFLSADIGLFRKLEQEWRVTKNQELILCCQLRLANPTPPFRHFEKLCRTYLRSREEAPKPIEIVQALAAVWPTVDWSRRERRQWHRRLVDFLTCLDWLTHPQFVEPLATIGPPDA
jgi:tetratricopeptide (TPR) repeat protein